MSTEPISFSAPEITETDIDAVVAVLRSGWITTGPVSRRFEDALVAHLGIEHVVTTSSCTAALECALASLRLPAGTKVAVPAWTFVSTVSVIMRLGLLPVLVDVEPDSLNISPTSLAIALDSGARAIVAVHFGGSPVSDDIFRLATATGVPVIEDCAHALGAQLRRHESSRARCYSFYATKNLTTAEGGAVATSDAEVAQFVRRYRLHGMNADAWRRYGPGGSAYYDIEVPGMKANLPDLLAALGESQLRRIDVTQARRRRLVRRYRELLSEIEAVRCVPAELDEDGADHLMVVMLPDGTDRGAVTSAMAEDSIGTSVHFRPVHHFSGLQGRYELAEPLQECDRAASRALSLPLHAMMTEQDVDRVVASFGRALRASQPQRDANSNGGA